MTQLVTVYDPQGEPFEIGHELAAQLVLNKGWSRMAPTPQPAPEQEPAVVQPAETEPTEYHARSW